MSYKVTASDIGAVQLNETDTVRSVLQNIAIILSTRQGTRSEEHTSELQSLV